jgi:hypothetical protein
MARCALDALYELKAGSLSHQERASTLEVRSPRWHTCLRHCSLCLSRSCPS